MVNHEKALAVLQREAHLSKTDPVEGEWVARVEKLSSLVAGANRTHIAMLGTALLARSANAQVDPFALKVSAGVEGAYSARSLAKDVLAANAPRLGINLGVSGREPLNNQPYFRGTYIDDSLMEVVRATARPAFQFLRECLGELAKLSESEASLALRAFIQVRQVQKVEHTLELSDGAPILEASFSRAVAQFVAEDSEGGKRAQGLAAGLLDVLYSVADVLVSRVNDPDRRFPGDVAVLNRDGVEGLERAFEVRDKSVTASDLYHFAAKVAARGLTRAAVVAVADDQEELPLEEVQAYAQSLGVKLALYRGWGQLVSDVVFHSTTDPSAMLEGAAGTILARLEEIEVSSSGVERWLQLVGEMERV
jgi:hypothetical protein